MTYLFTPRPFFDSDIVAKQRGHIAYRIKEEKQRILNNEERLERFNKMLDEQRRRKKRLAKEGVEIEMHPLELLGLTEEEIVIILMMLDD